MAIRTDIFTIDWSVSPRLIWVDISVQVASVQDLYDTCRYLESQPDAMDEESIIDGAGGEPLGGGVNVGLTISLINAQYAFADRPGPTWVTCNMSGGNVVAFSDADKTTEIYPRYPTAYVSADRTASSAATSLDSVWSELIDAGYDAKQILQMLAAVLAGTVSGVGTTTETFVGLDGVTPRVISSIDQDGNRTTVGRNV